MPICKYEFPQHETTRTCQHRMPEGARFLHAGLVTFLAQPPLLCAWACVNDTRPGVVRDFHVVGTEEEPPTGQFGHLTTIPDSLLSRERHLYVELEPDF